MLKNKVKGEKNKKLYRLPAFFMAATMLFTSIPFSSVSNAAGDAGMQENVSEVNLTEENETATAEGVLAEVFHQYH